MFFSRHPTDSKLLHSIVSHFIIPEAVMIEVSAKRFSPSPYPAPVKGAKEDLTVTSKDK